MKTAPAFRSTACFRNRTALTAAIGIVLVALTGAPAAKAGSVAPGATQTVSAGSPVEAWSVNVGATLNVEVGGATQNITAMTGSRINLTSAMVTGTTAGSALSMTDASAVLLASQISNATGEGLLLGRTSGGAEGSDALVQGGQISGVGRGIRMSSGSTLRLSGTTVIGSGAASTTAGIVTFGGSIEASDRTVIRGDQVGIAVRKDDSGNSSVRDGSIIIDNSRVEGVVGSAISVVALSADSGLRDTNILVRNGAQLVGGDGNLLTVLNASDPSTTVSRANFQVESSVLNGNVVAEDIAEAHVTLLDGGRINGRFDNVTSATIGDGGHWQLTGDSDVGALSLGTGGVVALGDGTAFNTLTVTGDYTGSGGALLFNTVLGDDTAASDKLIVNGSTSGQTRVAINNVGGIGAQTVNGIQLIQVDGASNGQFDLAGRAVGGQYEYFLFKGGKADPNDGDWYLRSELPVAPPEPDPCLADPNAPGCVITLPEQCLIDPSLPQCLPPVPVLRPEPGAYLANQSAAVQMFGTRFHDRNGGTARGLAERGAWARVSRNQADYGVIGDQLTVNGDTDVLQVGTDLFTWGAERGQLGVMLGSGRANNTVTSRLTGYSAKGKVEGQAIGVYGSWLQDPAQTTGLYVDAWAQHARFKNSVQGDGLSKERYDSTANSASVEAGYGVQVADGERVAMFVEPQLQLSYTRLNADTHVERNGTVIDGDNADGLTSRVGVRFFGHAHTDAGNRVQPFVSVNWIRESNENSLRFDGEQLSGGLPQNRYEAKAGASLQLGGRWTAWGDLGLQRGDGGYKDVAGQVGLRSSW